MHKNLSLSKKDKLKSVVRIDKLFSKGKCFWNYPFNVYYRIGSLDEIQANQMLVSVGKHYFKHAVDRNRMKRLVREAFRLNRESLMLKAKEANVYFNVGFVYKSKELTDFATVQVSIRQIISHLEELIDKRSSSSQRRTNN